MKQEVLRLTSTAFQRRFIPPGTRAACSDATVLGEHSAFWKEVNCSWCPEDVVYLNFCEKSLTIWTILPSVMRSKGHFPRWFA